MCNYSEFFFNLSLICYSLCNPSSKNRILESSKEYQRRFLFFYNRFFKPKSIFTVSLVFPGYSAVTDNWPIWHTHLSWCLNSRWPVLSPNWRNGVGQTVMSCSAIKLGYQKKLEDFVFQGSNHSETAWALVCLWEEVSDCFCVIEVKLCYIRLGYIYCFSFFHLLTCLYLGSQFFSLFLYLFSHSSCWQVGSKWMAAWAFGCWPRSSHHINMLDDMRAITGLLFHTWLQAISSLYFSLSVSHFPIRYVTTPGTLGNISDYCWPPYLTFLSMKLRTQFL